VSNQIGSDAVSSPKEPPIVPFIPWLVYQIKRKCHKRRAQREDENSQERSSRVTATATVVIAVFAVIAALVTISQAIIANRQLTAMQGQLNAMEADQRPWVGIEPTIVSELSYTENGMDVVIDLRLRNFGKSPALNTSQGGQLAFLSKLSGLLTIQQRICETAGIGPSSVIFPGEDPVHQRIDFQGGKDEVAKAKAATDFPDWILLPEIIGCIHYFANGDHVPHETGYMYKLMHVPPAGILDPRKGNASPNELLLVQDIFGNWAR
jgi:hypothetical protein